MLDFSIVKKAFRLTLPVLFGYIAIGIPFGMMVVSKGYPWWLAPLTGIIIFSGTAQYVAIAYFASNLASGTTFIPFLTTLLGIEFLISLRHSFYGISLIEKFKDTGKFKPYLIFALSDETYAIICNETVPEKTDKGLFYTLIAAMNQSYWVIGGLAGALIANILPQGATDGVDFALTCLFAVIMIDQIKAAKDYIPSLIGGAATVITIILAYIPYGTDTLGEPLYIIPRSLIILTGIVMGLAVITFSRGFLNRELKNQPKLTGENN